MENTYKISAVTPGEIKASDILKSEIAKRNAKCPYSFKFVSDKNTDRDSYKISKNADEITFTAYGIRGFMFAIGHFLRKTKIAGGEITLTEDIVGAYSPIKKIRGHQLGYRDTPNTYDAWDYDTYFNYFKELMFFGCNTMEHTHFEDKDENYNPLMKYKQDEFLKKASSLADEIDMDVSVWYPNDNSDEDEYYSSRVHTFEIMPRLDVIFPPGGDPGCFDGDEFVKRADILGAKLKKIHPNAELWPSAQTPDIENWGEKFIDEMNKLPENIDGVITGPNRAFDLDVLRKRLPAKYPIRLYPDITHNVRCEYPVHAFRDDWHYALASTLSRESVNPRPREYASLHKLTSPYVIGSVSYSEGVTDDVNKFVWSYLDYYGEENIRDIILDYARLFIFETDESKIADGILNLEYNWEGSPDTNAGIEYTYLIFSSELKKNPRLSDNWRFLILLLRAECDLIVRKRMIFENSLIKKAKDSLKYGDITRAREILNTDYDSEYKNLRSDIASHAKMLFDMIGLQLDVKNCFASSWERGAVLDTIDNPVTDRRYILNRLDYAGKLPDGERNGFISGLLNRNKVDNDEYYFSFAMHGFDVLGVRQKPDFYMDFQGDNPGKNNGSIPMCMLKVYDHYYFDCKVGGLNSDSDYKLILNIKPRYRDEVKHFKIEINGQTLYDGKQYGGERDEEYDERYSAPGFETHSYTIKNSILINGCADISIHEPKVGIMISEFRIIKDKETEK